MSLAHNPALVAIELIASSIWVGSLVCLAVVSQAASASIDPDARVALFRALGRRYGVVGSVALLTAIGVGLAMAATPSMEQPAICFSHPCRNLGRPDDVWGASGESDEPYPS
jgi:hypothetical protein